MQELIKYLNKLNDQGFTFWIEQEKRLKYMLDKLHPEKDLALAWCLPTVIIIDKLARNFRSV